MDGRTRIGEEATENSQLLLKLQQGFDYFL